MPLIKTFKAFRYNKELIKKLSSVVAPPYDIIPKGMQEELYRANKYNIVRLILGKIKSSDNARNNRYTRAGKFFNTWIDKGILTRDPDEGIYIYSQKYTYGGRIIERTGFLGLMGLDMGGKNRVLPHENTLLAPKLDRLNLMKSVNANLSPIFVLYDDKKHAVVNAFRKFCSKNSPIIDVAFEGVRHRVWRMSDPGLVKYVENFMKDRDIFIADGHHRFEVAKMYSDHIRRKKVPAQMKDNSRYLMVYFVESDEKALTILPAHRVVKDIGSLTAPEINKRLSKFFLVEKVSGINKLVDGLQKNSSSHIFGLYTGGNEFYTLKLKNADMPAGAIKNKSRDWKNLDVSILHLFIFQHVLGVRDDDDNIEFLKDPRDAVKAVDAGTGAIAFFLNPTKVSQVKKIAELGEKMPRKATYFYPKPLSGLVINKH